MRKDNCRTNMIKSSAIRFKLTFRTVRVRLQIFWVRLILFYPSLIKTETLLAAVIQIMFDTLRGSSVGES